MPDLTAEGQEAMEQLNARARAGNVPFLSTAWRAEFDAIVEKYAVQVKGEKLPAPVPVPAPTPAKKG